MNDPAAIRKARFEAMVEVLHVYIPFIEGQSMENRYARIGDTARFHLKALEERDYGAEAKKA